MLSVEPYRPLTTTQLLDAAISAAAQAQDADACKYESASVVATVTSHVIEGLAPLLWDQCQTVRAFAITARKAGGFLRNWDSG